MRLISSKSSIAWKVPYFKSTILFDLLVPLADPLAQPVIHAQSLSCSLELAGFLSQRWRSTVVHQEVIICLFCWTKISYLSMILVGILLKSSWKSQFVAFEAVSFWQLCSVLHKRSGSSFDNSLKPTIQLEAFPIVMQSVEVLHYILWILLILAGVPTGIQVHGWGMGIFH